MSSSLDASLLLQYIKKHEDSVPTDDNNNNHYFGHEPLPHLHLCRLKNNDVLMMARTSHCVAVQLLRETMELLLILDNNETITASILLTLSSSSFAAVVGTNRGRVLSVEIRVDHDNNIQKIVTGEDRFKEVVPRLDAAYYYNNTTIEQQNDNNKQSQQHHPRSIAIRPQGGVSNLTEDCSFVWISFGDGTLVRLHHSEFANRNNNNERAEIYRVKKTNHDDINVLPLFVCHPTPLSTLSSIWEKQRRGKHLPFADGKTNKHDNVRHQEALLYGGLNPTLAFASSEDQFIEFLVGNHHHSNNNNNQNNNNNVVLDVVMGVTGVVGSALGAVMWGFGNNNHNHNDVDNNKNINNQQQTNNDNNKMINSEGQDAASSMTEDDEMEQRQNNNNNTIIPWWCKDEEPIYLFPGYEIHDEPRQITFCTLDPRGNYAAAADNLGRVLLIDLSTKQIVRMWKGFREACCFWNTTNDGVLYLLIHSRQRGVLEAWQIHHHMGQPPSRVKQIQLSRDARVIPCSELSSDDGRGALVWTSYLLHTRGASENNVLEEISLLQQQNQQHEITTTTTNHARRQTIAKSSQEAARRLQRLQQLLDSVPCDSRDVYNVLVKITSLEDLAKALDFLAVAPALEQKMNVQGSQFQTIALNHCIDKLNDTVKEENTTNNNPHVQLLRSKIAHHSQVVKAYDILHKFETGTSIDEEGDDAQVPPRSAWAVEAMGWVSTYEKVTDTKIDVDIVPNETLSFAAFAKACELSDNAQHQDNKRMCLYFSDSSKTRREILRHVFKPLLRDIFAFKVVNSIYDALGIVHDHDYLLMCFGEWFMTLPAMEAARKALFALYSPMSRWLQEIALKQFDGEAFGVHGLALKSLHEFCRNATDLVRAFMLATICRDAVANAARQKESSTYGIIKCVDAVKDWERLLRQLRVCLLVSLRLHGVRLGPFPISIHNVDQDDIFAIHQWLAHDELSMSHAHDEIVSLESACGLSGHVFDPSTGLGDDPLRVRMIQSACLAKTGLIDDDLQDGALLLYLSHYNDPKLLVAHRALLLASEWGQKPEDLEVLRHAKVALTSLSTDNNEFKALAFAVRLEIWQTRIRPVYRAHLFGFDDVQELSESELGPLINSADWMNEFGLIALEILKLLNDAPLGDDLQATFQQLPEPADLEVLLWPPLREDFLLKRLVQKSRPVDPTALESHHVAVCSLLVSNDTMTMAECVPGLYEAFLPFSLFAPVAMICSPEKQLSFIEDSIIGRARGYDGPAWESFDLGPIGMLATTWGIDLKTVRTLLLLAMYEFGKDHLVDELTNASGSQIQVEKFVKDGVNIVCRRLNYVLEAQGEMSAEMSSVLGMLDADVCAWIHEQAEASKPLVLLETLRVPIGSTHLFAMRLLCLGVTAELSKAMRAQIHSLIVVSGTLVKAAEKGRRSVPWQVGI